MNITPVNAADSGNVADLSSGTFGTSRQVLFPRVHEIELTSTAVPMPAQGELLVRVKRVGICATDLHLLDGHIGDPFPLVPGHEFVGEVAAVGPESTRATEYVVGDRVSIEMLLPCRSCARCREGRYNLCDRDDGASGLPRGQEYGINIPQTVHPGLWGGYAEYVTVPPEAIVHRIPATIPWDTAALIEPLAVAFHAVGRGRVGAGDTVAIIGPGPVGLLAAAAASLSGASRIVMVGTRPSRLAMALKFGADATVDARSIDDPDSAVHELLGGHADVVIETAGVPAAQEQAARLVRRGGRVVLAGACGAGARVSFGADEQLLTREIDVLPSFLSAGGYEPAIAALERGAFPFGELISHRFPLDRVVDAFDLVRGKNDDVLKAILIPSP